MSEGRGGAIKYIIKNSDLFLNGKLIREGSAIELNENQTTGIEQYLIAIESNCLSGVASLEAQTAHSALDAESDSKSHPEQVYAEHSRSIEGSANEKEFKSKSKGNKK